MSQIRIRNCWPPRMEFPPNYPVFLWEHLLCWFHIWSSLFTSFSVVVWFHLEGRPEIKLEAWTITDIIDQLKDLQLHREKYLVRWQSHQLTTSGKYCTHLLCFRHFEFWPSSYHYMDFIITTSFYVENSSHFMVKTLLILDQNIWWWPVHMSSQSRRGR